MNGAEVLDVGRDAIWLTIQLCAPVLLVGLVVGVVIGLLQALTQVQEATLVYAPKIVAIFVSLIVFLPLMGALMSGFMRNIPRPWNPSPPPSRSTPQASCSAGWARSSC
jgi:flagellar biosynthetic protein FliQ